MAAAAWEFREVTPVADADSHSVLMEQRASPLSMPRGPARLQLVLRKRGLTFGLRAAPDCESYSVAWELDAIFYGELEPWPPST